jgi:YHS domain-containing protein
MRALTIAAAAAAAWAVLWGGAASSPVAADAGKEPAAKESPSSKPARPTDAERDAAKAALSEFNSLIGGWRGVGMPQRNSNKGAWIEKAEWVWDFRNDAAALRYDVTDGQLLQSALVTWEPEGKRFHVEATFKDDVKRAYEGKAKGNEVVLESKPDEEETVYRMTVTRLNDKRTLVLHEKRKGAQTFYTRIAEVGYTRAGTSLAIEGAGEPECVVSGGKGTIKVTYKGETYYVCCTGCKQAFDDDPEGILADYRRKVEERKKQSKKE